MNILLDRIQQEGKQLANGVLKVDSFMNHQIDPILMKTIGEEFAIHFRKLNPTHILTAESSGIAPALATAMALEIPFVYARKHKPSTMGNTFEELTESATKGGIVQLMIASDYIGPQNRILIIDDFLASARTIRALINLVNQSGATLVAIGAVIEKVFAGGRNALADIKVPVISLAAVEGFDGENIVFRDPHESLAV